VQQDIHVPFLIQEDTVDGGWTASAALTPEAFAHGEGETREAAIEDLKEAIALLVEDVGVPEQLVLTVEVP
jgi:predicted RNase H-like HicB family nuclease